MLEEALLGRRVVLRYRRKRPGNQPPLSDVTGKLTGLTVESATVLSRAGTKVIDRADVVAAKAVPASRREILELARISRSGWRAASQTELDGWLLSADQGWTGRANSALPLAQPIRPLDDLLTDVQAHYRARELPTLIQVPLLVRDALDVELARRGWSLERPSVVLTRPVAALAGLGNPAPQPATGAEPDVTAHFSNEPDPDWLAAYHYRGGMLPDFAQQLLTRHEQVTFASLRRDDRTVAIGRGVVDEGWLGINAVEVAPEHRRQGLAGRIMAELMDWGRTRGAEQCYLQVDEGNAAALRLYATLGFTEHHRYHYRVEPAALAELAVPRHSATTDRPRGTVRPA